MMVLAGAKKCFQYLKDSGLKIKSFISDRHRDIAKRIWECQNETHHYHDLWHVVKGISKKILNASKEKGEQEVICFGESHSQSFVLVCIVYQTRVW